MFGYTTDQYSFTFPRGLTAFYSLEDDIIRFRSPQEWKLVKYNFICSFYNLLLVDVVLAKKRQWVRHLLHSLAFRSNSSPGSSLFSILPTLPTADPRNAIRAHIFSRSTTTFAELCVFLLIRSSIDPTFCGICVCGPLQFKLQFISYIGAVRSSIDPICGSFLRGFAHVSKVGFVHPVFILYFFAKNQHDTWNLALSRYVLILLVLELSVRALKQSKRVFFRRASLFVAPLTLVNWRATRMACLRLQPAWF